MISIQEAQEIIHRHQPVVVTGNREIQDALGLVLAEDIQAPEPLPRFTNSAMDGFAVRWSDLEGSDETEPVSLSIAGESQAGGPWEGEARSGEAVRVSTGALLPVGTDTVIPIEDVVEREAGIIVQSIGDKHQHVRFEGEETGTGETVLKRGTQLSPAGLGFLASLGIRTIPIFEPPKVGIIATGSELAGPDDRLKPGQIRDSNGIMLTTAVHQSGGDVTYTGRSGDDLDAIRSAIDEVSRVASIVLICGGVSVGPHDLVKEAAGEEGYEHEFWRVRQKPGKPLFFARRADTLLFGLPGNPVPALNCYLYYVHPLLQRMLGRESGWITITGLLEQEFVNRGGRSLFLRVRTGDRNTGVISVKPLTRQESHMLSSMVLADGFVLLEAGQRLQKDEEVKVYLYPWG